MIKIGRVSRTKPHLLADTVEIAIAFGSFPQMSMTDLLGIVRQSPKAADELLPLAVEDIDDDGEPDNFDETEKTAREQGYVEEAWRQLAFRAAAFGNSYPFSIDGELCQLRTDLDKECNLYLLLLACSRTRSFKGSGVMQRLADTFEEVCAVCLRHMISPSGEIFMFGPNTNDRKAVFGTNLQDALPKLVELMKMRLKPGWEKNYDTSGDGKIDLVGLYSFDPFARGIQVVVGQCAAMEDEVNWERKRQQALLQFQMGAIDYLVEPQAVLFVPVCYRQPDGDWIKENPITAVVTMDRLRIMRVIGDAEHGALDVEKLFEYAGIAVAA